MNLWAVHDISPGATDSTVTNVSHVEMSMKIMITVNLGNQSALARTIAETWGSEEPKTISTVFLACPSFEGSFPNLI